MADLVRPPMSQNVKEAVGGATVPRGGGGCKEWTPTLEAEEGASAEGEVLAAPGAAVSRPSAKRLQARLADSTALGSTTTAPAVPISGAGGVLPMPAAMAGRSGYARLSCTPRELLVSLMLSLPLILFCACFDKGSSGQDDTSDGAAGQADADGDGFDSIEAGGDDCDDTDPLINPWADEMCNGIDDDCDGVIDEDSAADAATWYPDEDGDGYGDSEESDRACEAPASDWIQQGGDCDDGDELVNPDGVEICDGIDQDCDDEVDEDASDAVSWYRDVDEDGYGGNTEVVGCSPPDDGATWQLEGGDCVDTDAELNPGMDEVCDDKDNDCDGLVDDEDPDVLTSSWNVYYEDRDADGYGNATVQELACGTPDGFVEDATDCNDADAGINPGAVEVCDDANTDENCDGRADDDDPDVSTGTLGTWVLDADRDGYGSDSATAIFACDDPSSGATAYVLDDATDCDDADASINPGADEVCDDANTDEDCDGRADDDDSSTLSSSLIGWYVDGDLDGYGDGDSAPVQACEDPSTGTTVYVANSADCDDGNAEISPAAIEVCDAADTDEDCDGLVDDADTVDPDSATRYYADRDGDGYGAADDTFDACDEPGGIWTDDATDCDDGDDSVYPGAPERCDAIDQDCDPANEGEGASFTTTAGVATDLTRTFERGSSSSPVAWTSSEAGTLSFCGGTTYANLMVNHDLTVIGWDSAVLNGSNSGPVITVTGAAVDLSVQDLTLTGGDGDLSATDSSIEGGGGLHCYDVNSLSLDSVVITDNFSLRGGGLYLERCPTVGIRIEVSENSAFGGYGNGFYVVDSTVELIDSEVINNDNYTYYGGGFYLNGTTPATGGRLTLDGTTLSGNRAYYGGGGIALIRGLVDCVDGAVLANESYYDSSTASGGGAYIYDVSGNSLVSDGCDWGSGSSDNDPNDIFVYGSGIDYEVPTSGDISCSYWSCY
ncbi:MAG: hypothetical protein D6798_21030 [Deltaproteobacteria bacterium]|nr:MAG: hypothetical protein D6798_21030 [Deltaproteobacteria bacterium]